VLVAGGYGGLPSDPPAALNKAELYDPATGTWVDTGDLHFGR
jgi:hypothetical protein